jgi:hypothetical protein
MLTDSTFYRVYEAGRRPEQLERYVGEADAIAESQTIASSLPSVSHIICLHRQTSRVFAGFETTGRRSRRGPLGRNQPDRCPHQR